MKMIDGLYCLSRRLDSSPLFSATNFAFSKKFPASLLLRFLKEEEKDGVTGFARRLFNTGSGLHAQGFCLRGT